jgi:CheY-like chemotaxis protein
LLNLISNAIKFTLVGNISIALENDTGTDADDCLHFIIRDTGIGIASTQVNALFQPFSQVDASNTRKYGGTGLGLAISKRLCELMGGEIWVESEEGRGSTFHFTIRAPALEPFAPATHDSPLFQRTVLVVDDNVVSRGTLARYLQDWGMNVIAAASAPAALEIVDTGRRFDIALLDMHMGDMSGLTLAAAFRAKRLQHPLVLMAPVGELSLRGPASELGIRSILYKPVKPSLLFNCLAEQLNYALTPLESSSETNRERGGADQERALRILLAEDNLVNQKVAMRMLNRLGYQADVVINGVEALHAVQHDEYDIVLMDIQMPEMDGLEATRQILQDKSLLRKPYIIAMTAAAMQLDRDQCLEVGMNDFVSKPVRLEDLAAALARHADRLAPTQLH